MTVTSTSSYTLQNLLDDLTAKGDLKASWDETGYVVRPIVNIANEVMTSLCGGEGMFPWPCNTIMLPLFVWNSWQQDYALVGLPGQMPANGGPSLTNLSWLMDGVAININQPSMPKPCAWVRADRKLTRSTASYITNSIFLSPLCEASREPNNQLYYGVWGAAQAGNSTWGNNPQPNQIITNPIQSGAAMPSNPITQIQDANGNYLVLTQYGTTGGTAPAAPANSNPGTQVPDGSCVWTVVDPYGQGIRIRQVPSQTGVVWQINLWGQAKAPQFSAATSLSSQTFFPFTDDFYQRILKGASVEAMLWNPNPKVKAGYQVAKREWEESLMAIRRQNDRERENFQIKPARSIVGAGGTGPSPSSLGPFWPWGGPIS